MSGPSDQARADALWAKHLHDDDRPVHQPPAYDAPIPGIHFYAGCDPDGPRVTVEGVCEGCGENACPVCGRGGEMISCPDCGKGRVHYGQSCCMCRLTWRQLEERMAQDLRLIHRTAGVRGHVHVFDGTYALCGMVDASAQPDRGGLRCGRCMAVAAAREIVLPIRTKGAQ